MFVTNRLKNTILKYLINIRGWRTTRKIIVIESDDWGSIRMPSRVVYEKALSAGYRVDLNPYEKYDCLLSEKDLFCLFEVINSFKDCNGYHPIITANCVVANPNFEQIKECSYKSYHNELIMDTFKKYSNHSGSFNLWLYALKKGFIKFQYHGREHLNVSLFMDALRNNDKNVMWGFENNIPGMISKSENGSWINKYVEATRFSNEKDMIEKINFFFDGLDLFESIFNYKSKTVIPTNYLWNSDYNKQLKKVGVDGLQGAYKLVNPLKKKSLIDFRYLGIQDNIVNLVRNNRLELSLTTNKNKEFLDCIEKTKIAFSMKKPSIISMHRINFAGEIFESNRTENLNYLFDYFAFITKKWPDVEFLSSDKLVEEILG